MTRGLRVIVVDDGSACPVESDDFVGAHRHRSTHHPLKGPAGYCNNTGLAACTSPTSWRSWISDVTPRRGWLESHHYLLCDPLSHFVAPRIVGAWRRRNPVALSEALHSVVGRSARSAGVAA